MKGITAADHREFPSIRAWVEHYLEKIDDETTVVFQDVSHLNIRVYVSCLAKRDQRKLKTKSQRCGIMVWDASGSGPHQVKQRYHDENSRMKAVYGKDVGLPDEKPYELESPSEFCIRVISALRRGQSVMIYGGKHATLRQRVYDHGYNNAIVYETKISSSQIYVKHARKRD